MVHHLLPFLLAACAPAPSPVDRGDLPLDPAPSDTGDSAASLDTSAPSVGLRAAPEMLDLGDVGLGCEASGTVRLLHDGDAPLGVVVALSSGSFTPLFAIVEPRPTSIASGDGTDVEITFRSDDLGPRQALLTILPDDGSATLQVTLTAHARPDGSCLDSD